MASPKVPDIARHDLLAWAAYVLGHHPPYLANWLSGLWAARNEVLAGKCRLDEAIPVETDELIEAVHLVSRRVQIPGETAVIVTTAAERFRQGCSDMLRALKSFDLDSDVDGMCDYAPGIENFSPLVEETGKLLQDEHHLELWRRLGEHIAELSASYWGFPDNRDGEPVRKMLSELTAAGDYPFLEDLQRTLRSPSVLEADNSLRAQLLDPIRGDLDIKRIDAYLRRALREGARPEPWIVLNKNRLDFLGTRLPASNFTHAQFGIFWLLCETPRVRVERRNLIDSCNLGCSLDNIRSHVTRLRDRLRPAVDRRFKGKQRPLHADDAFIYGWRTHQGPYELMLDTSYVLVNPPRPDLMDPVRNTPSPIKSRRPR